MVGIIYKFTILAGVKYFGCKPFYIGQHYDINDEEFLSIHNHYIGSGASWAKRVDELKSKQPEKWRHFIRREILYSGKDISQAALDALEKHYIKKYKSHYSFRKGGCNVLWGTANQFGSGNPAKDPEVNKRQSESLKQWWREHPEEKLKVSQRRKNSKSSERTKRKISKSLKGKMSGENNPMYGKRASEETRKKMSIAQSRRKHRKPHTDETKKLIAESRKKYTGDKHPLFGSHFIWITNGKIDKRFNGVEIPDGWYKGRVKY